LAGKGRWPVAMLPLVVKSGEQQGCTGAYHLQSMIYLISLWTVILRKNLLYFFSSSRSDVFFRFFCVVYLLGVPFSALASVHSKVTIHLTPFFLAMQVVVCLDEA